MAIYMYCHKKVLFSLRLSTITRIQAQQKSSLDTRIINLSQRSLITSVRETMLLFSYTQNLYK